MNRLNNVLTRTAIKDLEVDLPNTMLVALVIGKQEHRRFQSSLGSVTGTGTAAPEERGVWNFTIRDSPCDYINVTYWGSGESVSRLDTIIRIGSIVEITSPRVGLRNSNDNSEQYRPVVTSPFHLTVNETFGTIEKLREYTTGPLLQLISLPTKPIFNYTTIHYIFSNIHSVNGLFFDLLVAVRQVGEMRIVQTKNGLKEMRKIVVFDSSTPAMVLTLWNSEYIARANLWKPRETVLFITDCKVQYESFSNSASGSPSMKSILTENPKGNEANVLRNYAKTAQLHSSPLVDQLVTMMPDPAFIKTEMNIRQIHEKIQQINDANSPRLEDNQFAVVLYAYVTALDLDGVSKIFSTRCSLCKSVVLEEECQNPICLSRTSDETMELIKTFDLRLAVSDRTGTLNSCRLSGKNAENVLQCDVPTFSTMTDTEKGSIKWRFLLDFCELRLAIALKNKRTFINILTCDKADISIHGVK